MKEFHKQLIEKAEEFAKAQDMMAAKATEDIVFWHHKALSELLRGFIKELDAARDTVDHIHKLSLGSFDSKEPMLPQTVRTLNHIAEMCRLYKGV